jgi:hypothetical protein
MVGKNDVVCNREIEPIPEITPQMIQNTFKALETSGMIIYGKEGVYIPTESGWKLLMRSKVLKEEINASGHKNILASHTTTFEITKAEELNKEGDCIIAVKADKACIDIKEEFRNALKEGKLVEITIEADGISDTVIAYGSPALIIKNREDIVIRKSDYIDSRTLAILANKSANELKQDLVERLRNPETKVKITLEIKR